MPEHGSFDEERMIELVYGKFGLRRYTQDSPILLDVFTEYYKNPDKPVDVLITPDWSKTPGQLADRLRTSLGIQPLDEAQTYGAVAAERHRIAYNQSVVAAELTFEELILHILPLSSWWRDWLIALDGQSPRDVFDDDRLRATALRQLREGLEVYLAIDGDEVPDIAVANLERSWIIRRDLVWAAHLAFVVLHNDRREELLAPTAEKDSRTLIEEIIAFFDGMVDKIVEVQDAADEASRAQTDSDASLRTGLTDGADEEHLDLRDPDWVFAVHKNRKIHRAVHYSTRTTKADAAERSFDVRGAGLRWAVLDSGIDATHMAFRKHDGDGGRVQEPFADNQNGTRIIASYDFSHIRTYLSVDQQRALTSSGGRMIDWDAFAQRQEARYCKEIEDHLAVGDGPPGDPPPWRFRIPHNERDYRVPSTSHGTHVAGILAADWDPESLESDPLGPPAPPPSRRRTGMCPEIGLYDLRVFDEREGDEFSVISALQFVRSLNQQSESIEIHGVNLSLAIEHDVNNYACGRSPVCEESTRLVGNGVVVVAAAGNDGRSVYTSRQGATQEGYRTVSIADPGNAEAVITVGSTHRSDPHVYGVSYFSSRGPTGDGRMKPDLVAPGEKIYSTVPGNRFERQDGTSQAAPHVSGAAALLMCRHRELIGQPVRVKEVLMNTATDLGRERHYQGAGLVDVMRAIQSV